MPWLEEEPSAVFRRQCWISFDPDESTLAFTARSPLVGASSIVWASDYPHPDAKALASGRCPLAWSWFQLGTECEVLRETARPDCGCTC